MAQVQKPEVRKAIITAARTLFMRSGYNATTVRKIAIEADVSIANVYSYYDSKLDLLFAIYDEWLRARLNRLHSEVRRIPQPDKRLRHVMTTLWCDIPAEDNGFANNLMQALSTLSTGDYDSSLIHWAESKLTEILSLCLPEWQGEFLADGTISHVLLMAFDGFALNHHTNPISKRSERSVELICKILSSI